MIHDERDTPKGFDEQDFLDQAMSDYEADLAEWRKLSLDRAPDLETAADVADSLMYGHILEAEREENILPLLENPVLSQMFRNWLEKRDLAEDAVKLEDAEKEAEIEKAMLDMQININRLAAKYYMAHDGDMGGFSLYADNFFARFDLNEPELRDYFIRESTFTKVETADADNELVTCAVPGERRMALRDAMLNFYEQNPQFGVSQMDVEGVDIGMFRDGIIKGPDGRAFSYEQLQPFQSRRQGMSQMA